MISSANEAQEFRVLRACVKLAGKGLALCLSLKGGTRVCAMDRA